MLWDVKGLRVSYRALEKCVYASWEEAAGPEIGFSLFVSACIWANLRYSMWV
jgi:hypothetical protein